MIKEKITEALNKQLITKFRVWDFDGTLIDTPLPDKGKVIHQEKTGKPWPHTGWWSKPESLDMNIFDMPIIDSVIKAHQAEQGKSDTLNIMMTGRLPKLANEVEKILKSKNLAFDKHIYNMGGATIDSKIKSLNQLLIEYPNVIDVALWDDRIEHMPAFEAWGKKQKDEGRLITFGITLVPSGHH